MNFFKTLFKRESKLPIALQLILLGNEYAKEQEKVIHSLVPKVDSKNVAESREYNLATLRHLGLEKTQNYRVLSEQDKENQTLIRDIETAKNFQKFIKKVIEIFPRTTFLVSFQQFIKVVEKYNLECGLLKDYIGVIPNKNIQEISEVNKIIRLNNFTKLNTLSFTGTEFSATKVLYIKSIQDTSESGVRGKAVHKYFSRNALARFTPVVTDYHGWRDINVFKPMELRGLPKDLEDIRGYKVYGELIQTEDFLIACPSKYLSSEPVKYEVKPKPIDPIVFQLCPYGVLIHSIWGEEKEDEILKEYERLTSSISNIIN